VSGRRIQEEELSRISRQFEECCGASVISQKPVKAKVKDETKQLLTVAVE
jgi:hypothetical protein